MRISSEGQATDTAAPEDGNRLKLLKKLSFKILQKAVDRGSIRCRMRLSKQVVSRLIFGAFRRRKTLKING